MTILLILAHPNANSFNHAIASAASEALAGLGHQVVFHDLYAEGFEPALTFGEMDRDATLTPAVASHCADLSRAGGIVVIHPNWWGMPPAILKGWVDRVIRPGVAYEFVEGDGGEGVPRGLLKAKTAVVFNTSNTYPERERGIFGDPLETIWKNCIFGLCGVEDFHRRTFSVVVTSTENERKNWLDEVRRTVKELFPAP